MRILILFLLSFATANPTHAQKVDFNLKKGFVAQGYDLVEYFNGQAVVGDKKFSLKWDELNFKFSSQANLEAFKASPQQFLPQYGGYCAYAIADKGKKVGIDPETFEIRDGKLYLFYNSWGTNTLEKWLEEGPEKLRKQANSEWEKVKHDH